MGFPYVIFSLKNGKSIIFIISITGLTMSLTVYQMDVQTVYCCSKVKIRFWNKVCEKPREGKVPIYTNLCDTVQNRMVT